MPRSAIIALLALLTAIVPLDGSMAIADSGDAPPATPAPTHIGQPLVLTGHTGPVSVLAWAPDGTTLASSAGVVADDGTIDPTVRLWRAQGTPVVVLHGHTGAVTALAWSPDGRILATGSLDGTARLWSAQGRPLATLGGNGGPVKNLAWAPDGRTLAVGSIDPRFGHPGFGTQLSGIVRLVHPDGTLIMTLRTDGGGGKELHLGWTPDGQILAAGAREFRLWRPDGTLVASLTPGGPAPAMTWSPDGRLLAIGTEDGTMTLYAPTGGLITQIRAIGPVRSLAFSPDSRTLAVSSIKSMQLFNSRDPGAPPVRVATYVELDGVVAHVAWSPDGRLLAGQTPNGEQPGDQTPDNILRLWRADGTPAAVLDGCGGQIDVVAWAPDGHTLAAGSFQNHTVCLWNVGSQSAVVTS